MNRLILLFVGVSLLGSLFSWAESDVIELGQLLKHAKKEERRLAVYQLQKLGPAAAPAVRQLVKALGDEDDQVWQGATMTLASIGPKASYAIPRLIEEMGGGGIRYAEQRRYRSAFALSRIGSAAVPGLVEALQDESEHRRWGALHALGLIKTEARPEILTKILPLLIDDEEPVRHEAEATCVAYGEFAVEPMMALIEHEDARYRRSAARVLRRLAPVAPGQQGRVMAALLQEQDVSARAALLEAAVALNGDPEFLTPMIVEALLGDPVEQDAAFEAALSNDGIGKELVPKLGLLLSDDQPSRRQQAAALLGRLGALAAPGSSALVSRLNAHHPEDDAEWYLNALILIGPSVMPSVMDAVRASSLESLTESHWAIRALQGLAPLAQPQLEASLKGATPSVACAILQALPRYLGRHRELETQVLRLLVHEEGELRARALSMLSRMDPPDKVWLKAEQQALKDPSPAVRVVALSVLEDVPLSSKERLRILTAALEANERQVRRQAVEELGILGESAEESVPQLLASAKGPSASDAYRSSVIKAFGRIGKGAVAAVPFLQSQLDPETSGDLRLQSLQALGAIGGPAHDALPDLKKLIKGDDQDLRSASLEAFARIEADESKLIPVFLEALKDPEPEVRRPVIEGLGRLGERGMGAASALVDLLESEPDRKPALEALREIRPDDIALCVRMLKSEDAGARLLACERLGRLRAKEALPDLRAALKDEQSFVRRRAGEAISRIERVRNKR
ncbi:MAG: HEAT repeat protein [Verrucomicrobiales bacterium]